MIKIELLGEERELFAFVKHYRHQRERRFGSPEWTKGSDHTTIDIYEGRGKEQGEKPLATNVAYCHNHDQFSKSLGREIAIGRALSEIGYKFDHKYLHRAGIHRALSETSVQD